MNGEEEIEIPTWVPNALRKRVPIWPGVRVIDQEGGTYTTLDWDPSGGMRVATSDGDSFVVPVNVEDTERGLVPDLRDKRVWLSYAQELALALGALPEQANTEAGAFLQRETSGVYFVVIAGRRGGILPQWSHAIRVSESISVEEAAIDAWPDAGPVRSSWDARPLCQTGQAPATDGPPDDAEEVCCDPFGTGATVRVAGLRTGEGPESWSPGWFIFDMTDLAIWEVKGPVDHCGQYPCVNRRTGEKLRMDPKSYRFRCWIDA